MAIEELKKPDHNPDAPLTDAERQAKIEALKAQIVDLTPKPKKPEELTDSELSMAFVRAVDKLLGAHPELAAVVKEMERRAAPPEAAPAESASAAEKPAA